MNLRDTSTEPSNLFGDRNVPNVPSMPESRKEDSDDEDDLNDRANEIKELPTLETAHVPNADRRARGEASKNKYEPSVV